MKKRMMQSALRAIAICAVVSSLALSALAQDKMGDQMGKMGDKMSMMSDAKVTVAVIRADWCAACQKVEPIISELKEKYKGRINFVVLDVSDDERANAAAAAARKHGLAKFFNANKKKTSTVVVLDAKNKVLFQTDHNYDRDAYVRAFDNAVAKAG